MASFLHPTHDMSFGNRRPSLGTKTRWAFPHHTKHDHLHLAQMFAENAGRARRNYGRYLHQAIDKHGDLPPGTTHTSGVYNPDFPAKVKDRLRGFLYAANEATDKSIAHWEAAGKRTPWRNSSLKKIAYPGEGLYGSPVWRSRPTHDPLTREAKRATRLR